MSDIFEQPYRPLKDMSRPELEDEINRWRNQWTWVQPDVQFWLSKVRSEMKLVLRNNRILIGRLGTCHFTLDSIELSTTERLYNYSKGEATYETKTVVIGLSALTDYEFMLDREVIKEDVGGNEITEDAHGLDLVSLREE